MAASCSRVTAPVILVPSEMPLSMAHFWPAAYHGVPEVETPSRRASIVTIMPRVVSAFGLNVPLPSTIHEALFVGELDTGIIPAARVDVGEREAVLTRVFVERILCRIRRRHRSDRRNRCRFFLPAGIERQVVFDRRAERIGVLARGIGEPAQEGVTRMCRVSRLFDGAADGDLLRSGLAESVDKSDGLSLGGRDLYQNTAGAGDDRIITVALLLAGRSEEIRLTRGQAKRWSDRP